MAFIKKYAFNETSFDDISDSFVKNWPVVYILEGKKEAYVGETADIYNRNHQHCKIERRTNLDSMRVLGGQDYIDYVERILHQSVSGKKGFENYEFIL